MPPDEPGAAQPNASAATGRIGEDIAAHYLSRRGCAILDRNWQARPGARPGEIDIVAECPSADGSPGRELAFVEVRTRHGRAGLAEESISRRKATSMAAAAYSYMASRNMDPGVTPWRIDLVAISLSGSSVSSINWVQGAIDEEMLSY